MKFLFDFFPILLFFIAYKVFDIYVATAVAILSSFVQVIWFWLQYRRLEKMHLITLVMITVLGGATLILQDETFIKWKVSVVNWLFGIVFFGSQFIGEKPIVQRMMEASVELPQKVWGRLNIAWSLFFISTGFLNLYVAYHFDTDTWVDFKMFGMIGLTVLFILIQSLFIGRYIKEPLEENSSTSPTVDKKEES